jgi:hypothetical protein
VKASAFTPRNLEYILQDSNNALYKYSWKTNDTITTQLDVQKSNILSGTQFEVSNAVQFAIFEKWYF